MHKDSIGYIVALVVALCLVCSAVVSIAAIGLRDLQQANVALERNANLLAAAGLLDFDQPDAKERVAELLDNVETRVVDLRNGELAPQIDPEAYDQLAARNNPAQSGQLANTADIAGLGAREHYGKVYVVKTPQGELDALVLPVRGYGLWSTMYGFIALERDLNTVRGFGFYQQGETPGLGGEVDNPKWKALWPGKKLFDMDGVPKLSIVKNPNPAGDAYSRQVDALSGATLTSRGVDNLIKFWMGELGYGGFLAKLRSKEIAL